MYIFNCLMMDFYTNQNMQQAKTDISEVVIDHSVLPFYVHILKQCVMYEDIFLTMLDIPNLI
jgi:hypothetical protein